MAAIRTTVALAKRRAALASPAQPLHAIRRLHDEATHTSGSSDGAAKQGPASEVSSRLPPTLFQHLARTRQSLAAAPAHDPPDGSPAPPEIAPTSLSIRAYIRSVRSHRHHTFLSITDGSLASGGALQVVLGSAVRDALEGAASLTPGAIVDVKGLLRKSKGRGQDLELEAEHISIVASCDSATYPIPLQAPSPSTSSGVPSELLRRNAHLRSREARHASLLRVRDAVERGMSGWLGEHDFLRVTAPIITSGDCEGAGEVFQVLSEAELKANSTPESGAPPGKPQEEDSGSQGSSAAPRSGFWSTTKAYLTVSSQLHLEAFSHGISRVWTCNPSFRAEGSATNRHLAEFWMCEAEQLLSPDADPGKQGAGGGMDEVMQSAQGVVTAAIRAALGMPALGEEGQTRAASWRDEKRARNAADMAFLQQQAGGAAKGQAEERLAELSAMADNTSPWPRISYTQAVELLQGRGTSSFPKPPRFAVEAEWGESLGSEHERWLAAEVGKGPIFVTDYPRKLKPFYMRLNDDVTPGQGEDRQTVACFDLLIPRVGELAGGSLREERPEVLRQTMIRMGLLDSTSAADDEEHALAWYFSDLRRYGCAPHGGWGLGVERLVSWLTGVDNVRDCITFPRVKGPVRF